MVEYLRRSFKGFVQYFLSIMLIVITIVGYKFGYYFKNESFGILIAIIVFFSTLFLETIIIAPIAILLAIDERLEKIEKKVLSVTRIVHTTKSPSDIPPTTPNPEK